MPPRHLARRIRDLRRRAELTQTDLAAKVGLSRIYIAKLEAGERRAPSLDALERLAKALGTTLIELLDPKAKMAKKGR